MNSTTAGNGIHNNWSASSSSSFTHFPNISAANCLLLPQQQFPPIPSSLPFSNLNSPSVNLNSLLLLNFSSNPLLNLPQSSAFCAAAKEQQSQQFPQLFPSSTLLPHLLMAYHQQQRDFLLKASVAREQATKMSEQNKLKKDSKKEKSNKYRTYKLNELHPDDIILDDVFNELNQFFANAKLNHYIGLGTLPEITKQFEAGGVAENLVITLETFKAIVHLLEICRVDRSIKTMEYFWPLFHQIYLHLDISRLNEAIAHVFSVKGLHETGSGTLQKIGYMSDSFPNFNAKFEAASQFIVSEPYSPVNDEYLFKCQHVCFFLMMHPRRIVKELTMEAMKRSRSNPDALYNLAQLFYLVPSLIMQKIPKDNVTFYDTETEEFIVGMIRQIYRNEFGWKGKAWKRGLLEELVKYLTEDFEMTESATLPIGHQNGGGEEERRRREEWICRQLANQQQFCWQILLPKLFQIKANNSDEGGIVANSSSSVGESGQNGIEKLEERREEGGESARIRHDLLVLGNGRAKMLNGELVNNDGWIGERELRQIQQQQHHQDRPSFSIDNLLGADKLPINRNGGKMGERLPPHEDVDYFMEERELSWTDGRRGRKARKRKMTEGEQGGRMGNGPEKRANFGGNGAKMANVMADEKPPPPQLPSLGALMVPSSSSSSSPPNSSKHVCAECGKSYATSSNLSRHKQTHRPLDSPHAKKCSFCDRVYVSMPALSMHLLTHQARHKCAICGKLFSRPWLLKGHLRSHTGQKPFGCGNCGKAFSDRSNLRAHLNTHNHDKRWQCAHCGRAFALKSYLSKHLEQQHAGEGGEGTSASEGDEGGSRIGDGEMGDEADGGSIGGQITLPSLCDDD